MQGGFVRSALLRLDPRNGCTSLSPISHPCTCINRPYGLVSLIRPSRAPGTPALMACMLMQRLLTSLPAHVDGAEQCLHHVLLWQYLARRNVMQLVELTLAADARDVGVAAGGGDGIDKTDAVANGRARRRPRAHFLETLGIPLCRQALAQVRTQEEDCGDRCALIGDQPKVCVAARTCGMFGTVKSSIAL